MFDFDIPEYWQYFGIFDFTSNHLINKICDQLAPTDYSCKGCPFLMENAICAIYSRQHQEFLKARSQLLAERKQTNPEYFI